MSDLRGTTGSFLIALTSGVKAVKRVRAEAIDISWSSSKLEKKCADDLQGVRHWGADNWRALKRRLAVLAAAPTLEDMEGVPGRCHQLVGDRAGQFAMDLRGPYRLIFEPDHNPLPRIGDGGIDRARVTKITIREVVNYHAG
jgi:toxin HigB-1